VFAVDGVGGENNTLDSRVTTGGVMKSTRFIIFASSSVYTQHMAASSMKKKWPTWLKFLLWALLAYSCWFILGIILVETHTVKEFPLGFNGVITDGHRNQDSSGPGLDGPHVFYHGDTIFVKRVIKKDTAFVGLTDTFFSRAAINRLQVSFENASLDFTTYLRPQLNRTPAVRDSVARILAISDIEGNFEAFRGLLVANQVIDPNYNWTFGDGHLVLVGDFFDRGLNVTECLWLIYDLEQKAEKVGGRVHFILGNHEIMNLSGNYRYVRNKYLENTNLIQENYKNWYTNTELGRWLRTKNIVEKVGPILFVHGGLCQELLNLQLPIDSLNTLSRPYYDQSELARSSTNIAIKSIFDSQTSPFWYRGYIRERANQLEIDQALSQYSVQHIVVGHSIVPEIRTFYEQKVVAIDVKHSDGINQGLLIEDSRLLRVDLSGQKTVLK
jgi:hypothetical protein